MKLAIISFFTLSFSLSAFSGGHICEYERTREAMAKYGNFCIKEVKKRNDGTKYTKYTMDEKALAELTKVTGQDPQDIFVDNRFWCGKSCQKEMIKKFEQQIASRDLSVAPISQGKSFGQVVQTADQTRVAQERVNEELQVAKVALDKTPEEVYKEFAGASPTIPYSQINNSLRCMQDKKCRAQLEKFTAYDTERTNKIRATRDTAKQRLEGMGSTLNEIAKDLDKAYGDGKFKKIALDKLIKADPSLKDELKSGGSIEQVCIDRSKTERSRTDADKKVIAACDKIKNEAEKISNVRSNIDQLKKDIAKSDDLSFLSAKLDLKDLEDKERNAALAEMNAAAKGKLEGTVLGHMMNQLREDMCTVAQQPGLCTGTAYETRGFVSDNFEIVEKVNPIRGVSGEVPVNSATSN